MTKQMAFYLDASACTACKACQVACKDKNSLPVGVLWRRVYRYEGGGWMPHPTQERVKVPVNLFAYSLSIACNHCENPACVAGCPTGAMHKRDDGIVIVDPDICIGCRYCEWACPYSAPQYDEAAKVMTKCDFCQDLLAQGERPACVAACPTRALDFGELEELQQKYIGLASIEPLPDEGLTGPSIVIKPHRHAQPSGKGVGQIANLPEEL